MDLDELRRNWESFGQNDPLWAVLSVPSKRGNRWDVDEFFSTGRFEVEALMDYLATLRARPRRRRALDFGCGVGRITQALARFFEHVDGVDISAPMIEHAQRFNRQGGCRFHLNTRDDLAMFDTGRYDLVYSNLVLQHMEPQYSTRYAAEFVRLLRPGGLAVFSIPSHVRADVPAPSPTREFPLRALLMSSVESLAGEASEQLSLVVRVENTGREPWPTPHRADVKYTVRLGNHWLDAAGSMYQEDDARTPLPRGLAPGEALELPIVVNLPNEPGEYILELDMVQEAVAWFGHHGSPTVRLPARVTGEPTSLPACDAVWEIHCVPRATLEATVTHARGRIVDIQDAHGAGPAFIEYRYVVTKDRRGSLWFRWLWERMQGRRYAGHPRA